MIDPYHIYNPEDPSISKTGLDLINKSPAKYYREVIQGKRSASSRALIFGQAFHASVLEPLVFDDHFVVMPDELAALKKTSKANKQAHADWAAEQIAPDGNPKEVLTPIEGAKITGMTSSILAHPLGNRLLQSAAQVEQAHYWTTPEGIKLRCKPDLVTSDGVVVDLKSTGSPLGDWHAKSAEPFRYDVQQVHYEAVMKGCGHDVAGFLFLVVTKEAPYDCAVFGLDAEDLY